MTTTCGHLNQIRGVAPRTPDGCEECLRTGGSWVHLRLCLTCGHVGCCDSQQGHNTEHAKTAGHPVIKSLPMGAGHFTWCYTCNTYLR